jgi:signal transduction histidine kinase
VDHNVTRPGLLPEWLVDAWLGMALCGVAAGRLLTGHAWDLSWHVVVVIGAAAVSLLSRRWRPRMSLAIATAAAVLAMPIQLDESGADVVLGGVLLVVTGARWSRLGRAARFGAAVWRLWRIALPVAAVAVVLVVAVPADLKEPVGVALLLAGHAMAVRFERVVGLALGAAAAATVAVGSTLPAPGAWTGPDTPVPLIAATAVRVAAGDAARSRKQLILAWKERTRRAEQSMREESRHRVVEERLRIAREVHDLVAHHIAVISMQAGVAGHALPDRLDAAMQSIGHVKASSRTVLEQLGTLLSVLRASEPAPLDPLPGMADLPELLASFEAVGLRVELDWQGSLPSLPPSVDLAAYRVVQEALTNAHKHGNGRAWLRLSRPPGGLSIEVP